MSMSTIIWLLRSTYLVVVFLYINIAVYSSTNELNIGVNHKLNEKPNLENGYESIPLNGASFPSTILKSV